MFETFSRGEVPYLAGNRDLEREVHLKLLEKGHRYIYIYTKTYICYYWMKILQIYFDYRLQKPELCSQIIYDKLMLPCWKVEPKSRPDFAKILDIIQLIMEEDGETI